MAFTVYILESSSTGQLYKGQTNNFDRRLMQHLQGQVKSTKNRGPWTVYKTIHVASRSEAMQLELKLKKMKNPDRVKAFLENNY